MTDIQVTLCTSENRGDHGADVRLAFNVEPGETVEHLLHRVMRMGEFQQRWQSAEPPSSWVELRYVAGTEPAPTPPDEAPF